MVFAISIAVLSAVAGAATAVPDKLLVSIWPEYSDTQILLVQRADLTADAPLPAEVRFSIPKDATVVWAGEILGSDPSKDLTATPAVNDQTDYVEVVFTLTKSRTAQVEAKWNGLTKQGTKRTVTLDWVQRYPATRTLFEFMEPSQATKVTMSPDVAFVYNSKDGFKTHQTGPHSLAVGQKERVSISYERSIDTPSVGATGAPNQLPVNQTATSPISTPVLIAILVVAVAGIGFLIYRDTRK